MHAVFSLSGILFSSAQRPGVFKWEEMEGILGFTMCGKEHANAAVSG